MLAIDLYLLQNVSHTEMCMCVLPIAVTSSEVVSSFSMCVHANCQLHKGIVEVKEVMV